MEYLLNVDSTHQEEKKLYATLFDLLSFEKIAFSGTYIIIISLRSFVIIQFIHKFTLYVLSTNHGRCGALSFNRYFPRGNEKKILNDGLLFTVNVCMLAVLGCRDLIFLKLFGKKKFTLPNRSLIDEERDVEKGVVPHHVEK